MNMANESRPPRKMEKKDMAIVLKAYLHRHFAELHFEGSAVITKDLLGNRLELAGVNPLLITLKEESTDTYEYTFSDNSCMVVYKDEHGNLSHDGDTKLLTGKVVFEATDEGEPKVKILKHLVISNN